MCDRFATSGFHSNMITYLTDELNLPLVKASNTLANFSGTASLTPLLGALVADSFAGRFWTITIASVIYELVSFSNPTLFFQDLTRLINQCTYILSCICNHGGEFRQGLLFFCVDFLPGLSINHWNSSQFNYI